MLGLCLISNPRRRRVAELFIQIPQTSPLQSFHFYSLLPEFRNASVNKRQSSQILSVDEGEGAGDAGEDFQQLLLFCFISLADWRSFCHADLSL